MKNDLLRPLFTGLLACLGYWASALSLTLGITHANCPDYTDGTATANATGGTEPYTYLWNTGATTQQITGLVPGIYNCTVTDAMGATDYDVRELQEAAQYMHYGVQDVQAACDGGCSGMMWFDTTQTMGGVAPFTFDPPPSYWVGDVAYFDGLCPFEFNYSITDATGCTENTGVPIGMPAYLLGEVTEVTPGCNGAANGSIAYELGLYDLPPDVYWPMTFTASDGFGNTFPTTDYSTWENMTSGTISGIPPGDYTLYAEFGSYCQPATLSLPVTVPDMGPDCGTVQGTVWYDLDHDCVIDSDEPRLYNRVNTILPGPRYAITNHNGDYSAGLDFGSYTIAQTSTDLDQICPVTSPVPFTLASGNQLAVINLGDTSSIAFDLETDCFLDVARPGFDVNAWIRVANGSVYPSGVVTLSYNYSTELAFVSADPAPSVSTPGHLEWQIPGLGGYGWQDVHVIFSLPPDEGLVGLVLTAAATAVNDGPENVTSNNFCSSSRMVTSSFDPNDKTARTSSGLSDTQYFLDGDNSVTYTIRFQNTGTDTAFTVVVRDTLEFDLDPGTLEILSSSHAFEPSFVNARTLVFTFDDILLPDSGTNEAASHGFIRFRIKPREDIAVGDVLSNTTGIYFDLNQPVITSTSELVVELSTRVQEQEQGQLQLFPNPAGDELHLVIPDHEHTVFSADVLAFDGRVVVRANTLLSGGTIDTHGLAAGVYTLRLTDADGGSRVVRFVKR